MDYDCVVKSGLKLKNVAVEAEKKKKKKKKKHEDKEAETVEKVNDSAIGKANSSTAGQRKVMKTKAEMAFQEMRDKLLQKTIKEKALKTHKQKVEDFNRHLDSLTEHFDIQKVSWTK